MNMQITDNAGQPRHATATMLRMGINALCLAALLALAAAAAPARAQSDPVGTASSVAVVSNVDVDSAYAFKTADFKFTDSDTGDSLVSITIKTLPSLGTLRVGETAATTDQTVAAADIGTITYYPEADASPLIPAQGQAARAYTAFDFTVTTGTGTNAASTADTTMSIVLVSPTMQIPASGTVDYFNLAAGTTFDEGQEIAVLNSGIIDPNGKPATSAGYSPQLQQAQPSATDPTMPGDWQDLGDALDPASPIFAPLPEHVGTFLRVCTSFTDGHATPRTETVCSGHRLVVEVADSPTGGDTTVDVPVTRTAANPHRFALADFPFSDVDGDERGGIRIITTPTKGTLVVVGDADLSIAANTDLSLAQLQSLAYYPDAMATTMDAYATFTYRVRDDSPDTAMTRQCSRNNCNNIPGSANLAISAATLTIDLVPDPANATGMPVVTPETATEDLQLTASQGDIADADGLGTLAWQWSQADTSAGPHANIENATAATFTPGDDQAGKFLQVCASFTDNTGIEESRCLQLAAAVTNINDMPTGRIAINTASNPTAAALTTLSDGTEYSMGYTTGGGTIMDADGDGLQPPRSGLGAFGHPGEGISWQTAAAPGGPWSEAAFGSDRHTAAQGYTPPQSAVGSYVRVCVFYMDGQGTLEGGDSSNAATRTAADSPATCSAPASVANANNAPVPMPNTVPVAADASQTSPYRFKLADFPFSDADGDSLVSITLASLPSAGTMQVDGSPATAMQTVPAADIGTISWWPAAGQSAQAGYATFTFNITDNGDDPPGTAITGAAAATITLDLVSTTAAAATGVPAITPAAHATDGHTEGIQLTASTGGITDSNGIDTATLSWQWYSAPGSGTPAAADYAPIDAATESTFTPDQPQVGMHIRVCAFFSDALGTAEGGTPAAPTLCSAAARVTGVDDAPMAANIADYRPLIMADSDGLRITPAPFLAAFSDEDGHTLAAVIIASLPDPAHGTLSIGNAAVAVNMSLAVAAAGTFTNGPLIFTPADDATTSAAFSFILRDSSGQNSTTAIITLSFGGRDIYAEDMTMVSAILNITAAANAADAIGGALSASAPPLFGASFDASLGGTSLQHLRRTLQRAPAAMAATNADLPQAIATPRQRAWYLGTAAPAPAAHSGAAQMAEQLRALADGGLAMQYAPDSDWWRDLRFWMRYQSMDISGNDGERLEYDGDGDGIYLGMDRIIALGARSGFALGMDRADIRLDLDGDKDLDDASRSTLSLYPYLRINLGDSGELRLIIGFGDGSIDIKSTANGDRTASADVGWGMLAASLSRWYDMRGRLSARLDGSLQYDSSEIKEARFPGDGARLQAAESRSGELAINAEMQYSGDMLQPCASLATRKWFGDLSQSPALDLALGTRLRAGPIAMRLRATRQLNDTTHKRDSLSLDLAIPPNPAGLSASLGGSYDSLGGRPQWQAAIGWQQGRFQSTLQAGPGRWGLQARLRW